MKSCIEWRKSFKYLSQADEFNIDFKRKDKQLIKFLDLYAMSQRVNIRMPIEEYTEDDLELISEINKLNKYKIAVILPYYDAYFANFLRKNNVNFYYSTPAATWDEFIYYANTGVSDIFVSGDLGFDLERLAKVNKQKWDVNIRCYVNIAQAIKKNGDGFIDFYIRPEDVVYYSNFVDVIEFWKAEEQQNVLYEVYFHDREWNGDLRQIIKGMTLEINNYYILGSEFARRRAQCRKKCIKGERCELCHRLAELATSLETSEDFEVFKRR